MVAQSRARSRRRRYSWFAPMSIAMAHAVLGAPVGAAELDSRAQARQAYERGAAAFAERDYRQAAREFARADELEPNDVALQAALDAAVLADDPVLGMTLAERAEQRAGAVADAGARVRTACVGRVGRMTIRCPGLQACSARVDRAAVAVERPFWIVGGDHVVEIAVAGKTELLAVRLRAGESVEVPEVPTETVPPAPGKTERPHETARVEPPVVPPPDDGGISPVWFWVGLASTSVLGGFLVGSGVDTLAKHEDYVLTPTDELEQSGRAAQVRTNVLIAATASTAALTAALGLFFVRWHDDVDPAKAGGVGFVLPY